VYQLNQLGVPSCIWSSSSSESKILLPLKRIEAIDEALPSSASIVTRTRLRSSGVTVVLIFTP
jgi:hypothetical protein